MLAQQVPVIIHQLEENSSEPLNVTSHRRRNRLHSEFSTTSDCSSSSISNRESSTSELSNRNAHRKMTFSPNPDLTIHEHTDESESNVFEDCTVIVNPELVNEMETVSLNKGMDDTVSDNDIHCEI